MSAQTEHGHSSVKQYWLICIFLCVLTFFEWLIFEQKSNWGVSDSLMFWSLLIMSLVKFFTVVGWYMHLKFDHKLVQVTFLFSLALATMVMAILFYTL